MIALCLSVIALILWVGREEAAEIIAWLMELLDVPVDIGDSGIYYLCEKCAAEPTRLPPDMFDYVTHLKIPAPEFVVEEVVINPSDK